MKENIDLYAQRIMNFDARLKVGGGNKLKHSPCAYAMAIKYFMQQKGITFKMLGEHFNGITPQAINHLLNRTAKEQWTEEDIDRYCAALKINRTFFVNICEKLETLLAEKQELNG